MCGLRYVGFNGCAVSDMWDSADVRSQICGIQQMCGQRLRAYRLRRNLLSSLGQALSSSTTAAS